MDKINLGDTVARAARLPLNEFETQKYELAKSIPCDVMNFERLVKNCREKTLGEKINSPCLEIVDAHLVVPRPIDWLWPKRIAMGKVSMIAGLPGLGKSMIAINFASLVSNGGLWPVDGYICPQGSTIIISAEDTIDDTIVPRLIAAGANLEYVKIIPWVNAFDEDENLTERTFTLKHHVPLLADTLVKTQNCKLIIIDPITAFLGGTDSHKNSDVREILLPLAKLAEKQKVAVVAVSHLNKGTDVAINRFTGSGAFIAAARAGYLVTKDKEDPKLRHFLPVKNNLGNDENGFSYYINIADNDISYISWTDNYTTISADDALNSNSDENSKLIEAKDFLIEELKTGVRYTDEVHKAAYENGISHITLRRAKKEVCVKTQKRFGDGRWEMYIDK